MADLPPKCPACSYDLSGSPSGKCPECALVSPLGRPWRSDGDFDLVRVLVTPWVFGAVYIGSAVLLAILCRTQAIDPLLYEGSTILWAVVFLFMSFAVALALFVASVFRSTKGSVHHATLRRKWAIASVVLFLFNALVVSADALFAFAIRV